MNDLSIGDFDVGKYYIFNMTDGRKVFGKLSSKRRLGGGIDMNEFILINCVVNNGDDSFRVTKPVYIYSGHVISYEPIKFEAQELIYSLSKSLESKNEYVDPETVAEAVQYLAPDPTNYWMREPERDAVNIYGDSSENESIYDEEYPVGSDDSHYSIPDDGSNVSNGSAYGSVGSNSYYSDSSRSGSYGGTARETPVSLGGTARERTTRRKDKSRRKRRTSGRRHKK